MVIVSEGCHIVWLEMKANLVLHFFHDDVLGGFFFLETKKRRRGRKKREYSKIDIKIKEPIKIGKYANMTTYHY